MKLWTLPVGSRGFDTVAHLTEEQATAFVRDGFSFCVPYLDAADAAYIAMLANAGLAVMATSYSRAFGWTVTPDEGATTGAFMTQRAKAAGFLPGVSIYLDLEGMSDATSPDDANSYVRLAAAPLEGSGFVPGAYVGDSLPLDATALYRLPVRSYWRSMSSVPTPTSVGYALYQLYDTVTLHGVRVDVDVSQRDYRLRSPVAMVAG
jgi:hypothetical protein